MSNPIAVITTIHAPTEAVKKVSSLMKTIVVGDEKTPKDWNCNNCEYVGMTPISPIDMPHNHYARKNLGYLMAIRDNATVIYDFDDDGLPNSNFKIRDQFSYAFNIKEPGWCNVYSFFTNHKVWPRGLPLTEINKVKNYFLPTATVQDSPIQQGLIDGSPDVDAIWRLTDNSNIEFKIRRSVYLSPGVWSAFNSESTWWFPEAYPLMYLPINSSFRMTDIWRSFVAQRCLFEMGKGVTFHSPAEIFQNRNPHDLMKDFEAEIDGYMYNSKIIERLCKLKLGNDIFENMYECYDEFVGAGALPYDELNSLEKWITSVKQVWKQ